MEGASNAGQPAEGGGVTRERKREIAGNSRGPFSLKQPVPRQISITSGNRHSNTDNTHTSRDSGHHSQPSLTDSKQTPLNTSGSGKALQLGSSKDERALWDRLEGIMTAKQAHVQQVLEEFGVAADVPPNSDPQEEQRWRVVQGELSLQEVVDLV